LRWPTSSAACAVSFAAGLGAAGAAGEVAAEGGGAAPGATGEPRVRHLGLRRERDAALLLRELVVRRNQQSCVEIREGARIVPLSAKALPPHDQDRGITRTKDERTTVVGNCAIDVALAPIAFAAIEERAHRVRVDRDGAIEVGERLIECGRLDVDAAARDEHLGVVRAHRDRLTEIADGLIPLPPDCPHTGAQSQRIGIGRINSQRAIGVRERVVGAALLAQDDTPIYNGIDRIRIDLDRALCIVERLVEQAAARIGDGSIDVSLGHILRGTRALSDDGAAPCQHALQDRKGIAILPIISGRSARQESQ
jgi:hypothetical protein